MAKAKYIFHEKNDNINANAGVAGGAEIKTVSVLISFQAQCNAKDLFLQNFVIEGLRHHYCSDPWFNQCRRQEVQLR
jgi:hypothetical protein